MVLASFFAEMGRIFSETGSSCNNLRIGIVCLCAITTASGLVSRVVPFSILSNPRKIFKMAGTSTTFIASCVNTTCTLDFQYLTPFGLVANGLTIVTSHCGHCLSDSLTRQKQFLHQYGFVLSWVACFVLWTVSFFLP